MSICTKCGESTTRVIGKNGGVNYWCGQCDSLVAAVDAVDMAAALRRETELRQRIAELEAALCELLEVGDFDTNYGIAVYERVKKALEAGK